MKKIVLASMVVASLSFVGILYDYRDVISNANMKTINLIKKSIDNVPSFAYDTSKNVRIKTTTKAAPIPSSLIVAGGPGILLLESNVMKGSGISEKIITSPLFIGNIILEGCSKVVSWVLKSIF